MSDLLQRAAIYVPITSITKADGGRTRIVTGVATSERLDADGQHADYEWAKAAATEWFNRWGNIREGHKPGGVGKAVDIQFDDAARNIVVTSKAIDRDTIAKLDEGVLNGYSWGAKSVPGNPIRIKKAADGSEWVMGGAWAELSYVDHPSNYDCTISLVKSVGTSGKMRPTKVLGSLADGDLGVQGSVDFDGILKAMLTDIESDQIDLGKRDISTSQRKKMGSQGQAISTSGTNGKKTAYPIANAGDLTNAIKAYGRANPADRAKVRAHIIRQARRLGRTDLIPDNWKSVDGLAKQAGCMCCDDCGPDCQGDCCSDCTMSKAVVPTAIVASVKQLAERETDEEYRAFLAKVAGATEAWAREPGVSISAEDFFTLGSLSKAAAEPDLTKARTFYSQQNRAAVEQAMFNLHNALGLFLQGSPSADVDQDQRNRTLTGDDAPPVSAQPGAGPNTPSDGVAGDGNLNFDPDLVRDGDPAVRTPDGGDARAQGEGGTHTWPPAGDAPGQGPGDKGKGEAPAGKGKPPFDGQQQAPDRSTPRGQAAPSKAVKAQKRLKKLEGQLTDLRKAAQPNGQPAIALQQSLAQPNAQPKDGSKALRKTIETVGADLRKALEAQAKAPEAERGQLAAVVAQLDVRLAKAMKKADRRARKQTAKAIKAQSSPLADALTSFGARLGALEKAATPDQAQSGTHSSFESTLLLADLQKAAYEQTRKDLTGAMSKMARRVKRAERKLQKGTAAQIAAGVRPVKEGIDALGRLPAPGGPQIARPQDKAFPVNETIERGLSPALVKDLEIWKTLSESTDQVVAEGARQRLRALVQEHGLTG